MSYLKDRRAKELKVGDRIKTDHEYFNTATVVAKDQDFVYASRPFIHLVTSDGRAEWYIGLDEIKVSIESPVIMRGIIAEVATR